MHIFRLQGQGLLLVQEVAQLLLVHEVAHLAHLLLLQQQAHLAHLCTTSAGGFPSRPAIY